MDSQEKSLELENEKNVEMTPAQAAADTAAAQEKVETTEAAADTTATPAEEKAEPKDGVSVVGGFVGGETARSQREFGENSWEAKHPTILQGYEFSSNPSYSSTAGWQANSKSYHVVWFAPAPGGAAFQNTTYLDGVTIEGGSITRSTESTIDKNYAPYLGAGVYLNDAKAYLRNSIVRYNNASMTSATSADAITPQGGGVYCKGGQVRYCLVYNNSAQQGGGVFVDEQGFVGNCMVTNNSGQKGGGVYPVSYTHLTLPTKA